jgi:hypothetical protein
VNNYDWPDNWWIGGARINIAHVDDEVFLRFLLELVHPLVRPDQDRAVLWVRCHRPDKNVSSEATKTLHVALIAIPILIQVYLDDPQHASVIEETGHATREDRLKPLRQLARGDAVMCGGTPLRKSPAAFPS